MQCVDYVIGLSLFALILILVLCCLAPFLTKNPACQDKEEAERLIAQNKLDQVTKPTIPNTIQ